MRFLLCLASSLSLAVSSLAAGVTSTHGIVELVRRRLPQHVYDFSFSIVNSTGTSNSSTPPNDHYIVSNGDNGTIHVEGNSPIALATGLRWYLANVAHVDIYWYPGSRLHLAPSPLPKLNATHSGSSVVPWRYHFNTVTFDYTLAWATWEDWEVQLDWMALRGINLPLAWVGVEKILLDVFVEAGFTQSEVFSFFSGPAFLAWNRFGNIQGSWDGDLPMSWIDGQFAMQKKIVARMVELGMTPVLPCFTGFVPRAIDRVWPNASFVDGSAWSGFPTNLTNTTFLEPSDPHFAELQNSFISKQTAAYGNVTHIYTLDQYNENDPYSGDLDYLGNVSYNTWQSLKNADPSAVWLAQGWLFYSSSDFWTDARIEAYLGGVQVDQDLLLLDLFSESQPQWQRTNSYYGKPWIWCQLHDYGGNMGLYGQVENVTVNPIAALANSSSLVGFGLTMEGQEGNEIMYDLLLDQAWSAAPLDTALYFESWVTARYAPIDPVPQPLYQAWDILRTTVYNNTNLTSATAVTKSIFELSPNTTGLLNRTGHHATTITYAPADLVLAWQLMYDASAAHPSLWDNPSYTIDLVDITRQVLANAFDPLYSTFIATAATNATAAHKAGTQMIALLVDLDTILSASNARPFSLPSWISSARAWATDSSDSTSASASTPANASASAIAQTADMYEYNARNQITLWGPEGEINDYASKQWGGLVASYYVPRWEMFVNHTLGSNASAVESGVNGGLASALLAFGERWDAETWGQEAVGEEEGRLASVMAEVVGRWPGVFGA